MAVAADVTPHKPLVWEDPSPMKVSGASIILCLIISAAAATTPALANSGPVQKAALLPVSGTNIHPGYLEAARDTLKDHLLATGRYQAITVPGEPGTVEASAEQAAQRGREVGADLAVVLHLSRLSSHGRVRMVVYQVGTGAFVHADSMAVAGGPDDLDPVLQRMAIGLATGKPASQTADIESVTQKDADPLRKQVATKMFGVRLGAIVATNRPGDLDSTTLPGVGVFWLYDARSFLGEVALDLYTADSSNNFSVSIAGYYPFSGSNLTPYLGTSASYAFVDFGGEGANGIRVAPAFGMLFGRLSTVQFRGELGYFFNTFGERATIRSATGTAVLSEKHYAHGPQFLVGLGF